MSVRTENLSKCFSDANRELTVIDGLTYSFPEFGSAAILGMSGVGKSTLLQILGGLDVPSSGSVFIDDQNISLMSEDERAEFRRKSVGFIFQFHHLLPDFTALENAAMPLRIRGIDVAEAERAASEILDRVGLGNRMQHRPAELSGGEQQRVAIARAIVGEPRVILADEPTGNLDSNTASEIQEMLLQINRELKNILIVVTHNRHLAASMDLVLEMESGGALRNV